MRKELNEIAEKWTEPEYRQRPELSYSTLSTYEKLGFNGLDHLFDKIETPSLTFGSCVDAILTGGEKEFNDNFIVLDIKVTEGGMDVCKKLISMHLPYVSFNAIPEDTVSNAAKEVGFWKADKWDKIRYREVLKTGNISDYYNALLSSHKTVIDKATYDDVIASVRALRESPATANYFAENDKFSPIQRHYQLKFKARFEGVGYRCMADLICTDHDRKVIVPCDLKTSSHAEWDFEESFTQWGYQIQARLYWRIIRANMNKDPYFKDFKLENYRFIVINKRTLTPLVWEFPLTQEVGTLMDLKGNEYRDPLDIGKELRDYLDRKPRVPKGVKKEGINIINCLKLK